MDKKEININLELIWTWGVKEGLLRCEIDTVDKPQSKSQSNPKGRGNLAYGRSLKSYTDKSNIFKDTSLDL